MVVSARHKQRISMKLFAVIALGILLLLLLSVLAVAAGGRRWTAAGVQVAALPAFNEVSSRSCSDGQGGAIVAWLAQGATENVYVQRLDSAGAAQWTAGGFKLTSDVSGGNAAPQVVSDDNNGAIVCWIDDGSGTAQVYGLHILNNGTIDAAWTGSPVVAASGGGQNVSSFVMARDGSGGALLAYQVFQAGGNNLLYAQNIRGTNGTQVWGVGRNVKNDISTEEQADERIVSDGAGGAVIAFTGNYHGVVPGTPRAYVQRFEADGFPHWNTPGAVLVANRATSYPGGIDLIDGSNVVVAFDGSEDVGYSACVQKFNMLGAPQWTADGVKLDSPGGTVVANPKVVCDSGSALVTWDHPSDKGGAGVWAQKVNSSGAALWTAGGVRLSDTINDSGTAPAASPSIATDGLSGAICSWTDIRSTTPNVFVQRLDSSGAGQWGTTGMAACTQNSPQSNACLVSDGALGAILAWEDERVTPGQQDLFAQRVSNAAPTFSTVSPTRSLTNNNTTLAITGTGFLAGAHAKVRLHGSGTYTTAATDTLLSSTRLNAVFNFAGFTPGVYDVAVWNNDGQSVWGNNALTLGTAPHITSVSSTSTYPGGPAITVNGTNFTTAGTLSFNGVPATSVTSWTGTRVVAQAPEGSSSGPLAVTTEWGTSNTIEMTLTTPVQNLAEGSNAWGFDTSITVVNTTAETKEYQFVVNPSGETPPVAPVWTLELAPLSTMDVTAEKLATIPTDAGTLVNLENMDFSSSVVAIVGESGAAAPGGALDSKSSIFADRTMEWRGSDADSPEITSSIGATTTSRNWYMPEGSSNWGFETWTLVQNPGKKKAVVNLKYMIEGKTAKVIKHEVPAKSRATYSMEQDIGKEDASIEAESDEGVICERSMYRNNKREGHDSVGATRADEDYYLAEGTTAWGFTTYVLIQNPNDKSTDVTLTFMTEKGPKVMKKFTMKPNSRKTVRVNDVTQKSGEDIDMSNCDFSTKVHGSRPIIAERAMYWGSDKPQG
jgi:hypothetical protein